MAGGELTPKIELLNCSDDHDFKGGSGRNMVLNKGRY